ncbi:MAG: transglutaminase-like cysteine peptidase [Campylobacterales bacterium]|nr:transglutaminase-like cysteine peptidase [Campylobacterales bacterium]
MNFFKVVLIFLFFTTVTQARQPYADVALIAQVGQKYDEFAKKRFFYQQQILDSVVGKSDLEKMEKVNTFYNEVKYTSDMKVYGVSDYWATPWEFLAKDMGDCEDYVIAKYFALIYLGVDSKKLFFTYVRSTQFKEAHMVLTYFATARAEPLIMDNNNRRVLPASKRLDLTQLKNLSPKMVPKEMLEAMMRLKGRAIPLYLKGYAKDFIPHAKEGTAGFNKRQI